MVADASMTRISKISNVTLPLENGDLTLDYGRTYIVSNEKMDMAMEIITKLTSLGEEMMCVSRMHPDHVSDRWPMGNIKTYWLTQRSGPGNVSPDQPTAVKAIIESFLRSKHGAIAILDGFEHLSVYNDFHVLNVMFEEMNDVVMETRSILLVPIDPRSLDEMSMARLRRFAEIIH